MRFLATSLVSFRISYIRSESRTNFSFQSNEGARALTSVDRLYSCLILMKNHILHFLPLLFDIRLLCLCIAGSGCS
jgi:hypothetical protein